jgi:thiamine-phosphate pyrophosphorylase
MVQLREKNKEIEEVLAFGEEVKKRCREKGVPFVVNDRVDLAMLLDADGVHVGQSDIPGRKVRALVGRSMFVGISASSIGEAMRALDETADYLGVGSIYATQSKADAGEPVGVELIKEIRKQSEIPLVGIGGITAQNARPVIACGADGVAVISAITQADDPMLAAQQLRQAIVNGKKDRI